MTLGLLFWILMILWLVLGFLLYWPGRPAMPYGPLGGALLLFVLFFLLGWAQFGPMLK